jgi:hypothetical protein
MEKIKKEEADLGFEIKKQSEIVSISFHFKNIK